MLQHIIDKGNIYNIVIKHKKKERLFMNYVKVYTKTYRDNSARYIELPSLLIEQDSESKI